LSFYVDFALNNYRESSNKWQSHLRVQQEELKAVSEEETDVLSFDEYYRWLVTQFHTLSPRKLTDLARVAFDFEDGYPGPRSSLDYVVG